MIEDPRPLYAVLISLVAMLGIFATHHRPNLREAITLVAAFGKFGIVASMVPGVLAGETYVFSAGEFVAGIGFVLRADSLGTLFAFLASLLWIFTSFYSIGYMRGLDEHGQTRYFASFAASLAATMGIAFAGNLVTIFLFYELLSIATYPLVAHDETTEARSAGRKYLAYTMFGGGVLVLAGTVLVFWLVGTVTFTPGGIAGLAAIDPMYARLTYAILAIGFGVKAGLMPLHQWLPVAMVAPTPVSGLLHAVAVVKSGAFGVARVTLYVFGPELAYELGMAVLISGIAAFTLLAASVIAMRKDHLKQRLAYSTVSQLSYIVLGLGLFGWHGLVGALLHIPAHAFMKLTLFFCAGAIHVETHMDYISKMAGIGKRMPVTLACFALAAAGMAGIPLVAGFVSKSYLIIGGAEMGGVGLYLAGALLVSGVLNIAYFWPVVYTAFFESAESHDAKPLVDYRPGGDYRSLTPRTDGGHPDNGDTTDDASEDTTDGDHDSDASDDTDHPDDVTDIWSEVAADAGDRRDYSDPAPRIDGEYAVDTHPSDHTVPDDPESDQATHTPDERQASDSPAHTASPSADAHGGPPADGWDALDPREALVGRETTWFMLGPIIASVAGAILLGIVPGHIVFLDLIEVIVDAVVAGTEVAR